MTPTTAMSAAQARVLVALIGVRSATGRATVRAVAATAGRSVQSTHARLCALEREGLVAWEAGRSGTLRPLVGVLAANVNATGVEAN